MTLGSFYYKLKAKQALKGNWQTAMVITFFSGIFLTAGEVFRALYMPVYLTPYQDQWMIAVPQMDGLKWIALGLISLLSLLLTPMLSISCNYYFVRRVQGEDLGTRGLWSRKNCFGKALGLYLLMGLKIFLWGLLLVVPGVIAALRYSLAPYYLAQNPEMSVSQAIEQSKKTMAGQKAAYFLLLLSFIGWTFLSSFVQLALTNLNGIVATVAGLFFQVWIGAYTNGATAAFYLTQTAEGGMEHAYREMRSVAQQMGMETTPWDELPPRKPQKPETEDDGAVDGDPASAVDPQTDEPAQEESEASPRQEPEKEREKENSSSAPEEQHREGGEQT